VKVNPRTRPAEYLSDDPQSYKGAESSSKSGPDTGPPDGFNPIAAALAAAPAAGGPPSAADGDYARLPPAFPPEGAAEADGAGGGKARGEIGPGRSPGASLLDYRDRSADSTAGMRVVSSPGPLVGTYLVPKGTLIAACLLTEVDTANPSAIVQFAAARALVFNHRRQLPFGTRFLGALSGPALRDRLNLAVDTILYPDGMELPVRGDCVEADDVGADIRPGIGAYYFPPPSWAQAAPYVSEFVTGYLGLLESRAEPQVTIGGSGVSVQSTGVPPPQAQLYQASAQAIQGFTSARLKEIEQRYAAHYVIPAGTRCWLQLTADLDLGPAHATPKPDASSR
jgi:hypothetical protein